MHKDPFLFAVFTAKGIGVISISIQRTSPIILGEEVIIIKVNDSKFAVG
jgi:hypothetical protein